jgi:prevent-host-death family protein
MTSEIPVTQARDELADLINRVAYGHERIVLTRHSRPVACLVPAEDLELLERADAEQVILAPASPVAAAPGSSASGPAPLPMAAQYQPPGPPRH